MGPSQPQELRAGTAGRCWKDAGSISPNAVLSCTGAGKGSVCTKGLQALRGEDATTRFIRHIQNENSGGYRYTNVYQ